MRVFLKLPAALVLTMLAAAAAAQPAMRVLSSNGMKAVLEDLQPQVERELGRALAVQFDTTAGLRAKIEAGEAFDVTLLTTEAVDALAKSGKIAAASVVPLGRGGLGVGVRKGAAKPPIGTPEQMRSALLAAKSFTWVGAGATRITIERMLATLGIAEQVQAKIVLAPSVEAANESVVDGRVELVLMLTSEILPVEELDYLGPLPGDLQGYVSFAGGVAAGSPAAGDAARLIASLRTPNAARVYAANGMETASTP